MNGVSIIRNKGQLTIPDSIRKTVSWVNPLSAISITVVKPDEIVIRPHQVQVDWDKIWAGIKKTRSITSKNGKGNLSEFIAEDRYNH